MRFLFTVSLCLILQIYVVNAQVKSTAKNFDIKKPNPSDTLVNASTALLKEIHNLSFKLLEALNKYKEIRITTEFPFNINLSHTSDGPMKISGEYDQIRIQGEVNLIWSLVFSVVGEVTTTYGTFKDLTEKSLGNYKKLQNFSPGGDVITYLNSEKSKKDGMYDASRYEAFIESGDISIEGQYSMNGIVTFFETGSINFSSFESVGEFSNGTRLSYNGVKYVYSNKIWVKQ